MSQASTTTARPFRSPFTWVPFTGRRSRSISTRCAPGTSCGAASAPHEAASRHGALSLSVDRKSAMYGAAQTLLLCAFAGVYFLDRSAWLWPRGGLSGILGTAFCAAGLLLVVSAIVRARIRPVRTALPRSPVCATMRLSSTLATALAQDFGSIGGDP